MAGSCRSRGRGWSWQRRDVRGQVWAICPGQQWMPMTLQRLRRRRRRRRAWRHRCGGPRCPCGPTKRQQQQHPGVARWPNWKRSATTSLAGWGSARRRPGRVRALCLPSQRQAWAGPWSGWRVAGARGRGRGGVMTLMRAGRRRMAAAAVVDGGGMKRKERRGGGWTSAAIVDGAIAATGTPCCGGTARGPTQNPRSQWPWSTISGDGAEAERMLSGDGDDDGRS